MSSGNDGTKDDADPRADHEAVDDNAILPPPPSPVAGTPSRARSSPSGNNLAMGQADDRADAATMPPPSPITDRASTAAADNDDDDDDDEFGAIPPTPAAKSNRNVYSSVNRHHNDTAVPATPASRGRVDDDQATHPGTPLTPLSVLGGTADESRVVVPSQLRLDGNHDDDDDNDTTTTSRMMEDTEVVAAVAPDDNDNNNNNNNGFANHPPPAAAMVDEPLLRQAHIRGTDVHVPTVAAAVQDFLRTFVSLKVSHRAQRRRHRAAQRERRANQDNDNDEDEDDNDNSQSDSDSDDEDARAPPLYQTKLQSLLLLDSGAASLEIDTMHLYYHSQACQQLYHQLIQYPMEMVPLLDILTQRELERLANNNNNDDPTNDVPRVQVRPYNLKSVSNLRELDPVSMDTLVSCKGMIVRSSPIIPDLKVAHFMCSICGTTDAVTIDRGRIAEPTRRCDTCHTAAAWQLVHNRCLFADKQLVRLQETPDEVPAGQTPASVVTFCYDDLVDTSQPGDKVEVTGVLRAQPIRVNPKISKVKTVYKTYLDVIHFRKVTGMETNKKEDLAEHGGKSQWTEQRIAELKALSQDPTIYQKLTESLAPSIWELEDCKKGILCMLFGGNHLRVQTGTAARHQDEQVAASWMDKDDDDAPVADPGTSKLHKRGDINILLCGDPGTSKSQLLSYVNKLSPRGVYTSGKGSSAVGLTASVVRDPETRDLVLESGALVLSDLGICCIDEFDKMSDTTRSVLHEAMEQQTVSIAKAGIIATLHARTSVLASANPSESRYNPNKSVVDNIQLPPTLLSRFDLIYLILDSPNVDHDRKLAQHLVGLYYETPNVVEPPLNQALLRDYIEYARENIHPEISNEASAQLVDSYLEMRNPPGGAYGQNGTRTISATARQLESLIRLSEGLAKMRFSPLVTRSDAREAVRLMKVATQAAATDPRTGRIDMDMITTGRSTADRELEEMLDVSLKELFQERRGSKLAVRDVTTQLAEITDNDTIPHDDVVEALRRLHADGVIQFNERAQTVFVRSGILG